MQLMRAGFGFDVAALAGQLGAGRMDVLTAGLEQFSDRVLGEPVDLKPWDQPTQLGCNGHVSASVAKPDRRRDIQRPLATTATSAPAIRALGLPDGIDEL